ncbi:MAG TPA: GNAT family N-acetyltransferase [Rhodocyclaceae bacterium]|jgi:predicted GNAT family N-acyltransferase
MTAHRIRINLSSQTLELRDQQGTLLATYPVSTAAKGAGEVQGSYQTPRGKHIIRAKVGAGQPANAVFVARRPTGEVWTPALGEQFPDRDWILTRILWLSGKEPGFNRRGSVDTMRRYVYIHGTPETTRLGQLGSHGCIRMDNAQLIDLFDRVEPYTPVDIVEFLVQPGSWGQLGLEAFAVREKVFIQEQAVPAEMELDEFDPISRHVLARTADGQPIGTGRLLADGHIGRLAVVAEWRGKGVGQALMDRLLDLAREAGITRLALHAQTQAAGFYRRFGFVESGEEFMEAGIPHVLMVRA